MAATRVVVDPITRIEGHLRIEAQAEGGRITNAWAHVDPVPRHRDHHAGTGPARRLGLHPADLRRLHRGARRRVLPRGGGRAGHHHPAQRESDPEPDPRNAVHPGSRHPLLPPARARLGGRGQRAEADPGRHRADRPKRSRPGPTTRRPTSRRCRTGSSSSSSGGQLGIFTNGYWGHPAYKLPPEVNLLAVAHYLEALDWQRDVIRVHTIFGGKNPHPNFLVGGMASAINLDGTATINAEKLVDIQGMIRRARTFVEQVYWPDLVAIAGFYKDWAAIGGGVPNFLAVRRVPRGRRAGCRAALFPPRHHPRQGPEQGPSLRSQAGQGVHHQLLVRVLRRRRGRAAPLGRRDQADVHRAHDRHAKYLQDQEKYTWMKAPRYEGRPMQVGPLARMLVAYGSGHAEVEAHGRGSAGQARGRARPRSSRPSAAPPRAASRRCCWPGAWRSGSAS